MNINMIYQINAGTKTLESAAQMLSEFDYCTVLV